MKRICTLLVAAVFVTSAPSSLDAKNPKGCKRTNVRSANPQGSVLVQPATRAATATAVPLVPGQSTVPVVVFGGSQAVTGVVSGMSTADGTVVPSITSEAAPQTTPTKSRKKRARRRTSTVIDLPSSPDAGALAAVSRC